MCTDDNYNRLGQRTWIYNGTDDNIVAKYCTDYFADYFADYFSDYFSDCFADYTDADYCAEYFAEYEDAFLTASCRLILLQMVQTG